MLSMTKTNNKESLDHPFNCLCWFGIHSHHISILSKQDMMGLTFHMMARHVSSPYSPPLPTYHEWSLSYKYPSKAPWVTNPTPKTLTEQPWKHSKFLLKDPWGGSKRNWRRFSMMRRRSRWWAIWASRRLTGKKLTDGEDPAQKTQ